MIRSQLPSLLVKDGLVSPEKMVEAIERQVILGGTIDTALLELGVATESALVEALCRVTALPTLLSVREAIQLGATEVERWFPAALVEKHRAVPISASGNIVKVATTDPPNRDDLDTLGQTLGRSVDPVIVTEARFEQLRSQLYGHRLSARFESICEKLQPLPGRGRDRAAPVAVVDEPLSKSKRVNLSGPATAPTDITPLSVEEALHQLGQETDREAVFTLLCRGARSICSFVSIWAVRDRQAMLKAALGDQW